MDRFWSKVFRHESGCLEWRGATADGYGRFWFSGSLKSAHRVAYEMANGEIPPEMVVDHLCGNRACVNVEHLQVVSQGANVRRGKLSRLTMSQRLEILRSDEGADKISRRLGVGRSAVRNVRKRGIP